MLTETLTKFTAGGQPFVFERGRGVVEQQYKKIYAMPTVGGKANWQFFKMRFLYNYADGDRTGFCSTARTP